MTMRGLIDSDTDATLTLPLPLITHLMSSLEGAAYAIGCTVVGPSAATSRRPVKVIGMSHGGEAFVYQDGPAMQALVAARAELRRGTR